MYFSIINIFIGITIRIITIDNPNGNIENGLKILPNNNEIIYGIGNSMCVKDIFGKDFKFLYGHSNRVSCLDVSKSGKYIASGQINHQGFKAKVFLWNTDGFKKCGSYEIHKVKVQALAFSPNDLFLVSLGGEDDNSIVVYDLKKKEAICGCAAASLINGRAITLKFFNGSDNFFFTAGIDTLRLWNIDTSTRHVLTPMKVNLGKIKREINAIAVTLADDFIYCGTSTGDILKIRTNYAGNNDLSAQSICCNLQTHVKKLDKLNSNLCKGITSLVILNNFIIIGCGDGGLHKTQETKVKKFQKQSTDMTLKLLKSISMESEISSIAGFNNQEKLIIGTIKCKIYLVDVEDLTAQLLSSSHSEAILDIAFPHLFSEIFATCSKDCIKVWNTEKSEEVLEIVVSNVTCNAIAFLQNGKGIVSGWDDGKIRTFTPETSRLMFVIHNADSNAVTALAVTSNCKRILSGGEGGHIRVWDIEEKFQSLKESMKEHKGAVSCIKFRKDEKECVSASIDGTCIIWDLTRFTRSQIIFANNHFKNVCYHPDECQILTCGTDRMISYWEIYNGTEVKEFVGSETGSVNTMDISEDGLSIISGGNDKIVKVWKYDDGMITHIGEKHSSDINKLCICPNSKYVISVSSDGAIRRWKYPIS